MMYVLLSISLLTVLQESNSVLYVSFHLHMSVFYIDQYDLEDFFIQFFLQELDIEIILGRSFRDFYQLFIIMYNP